MEQVVSKLCTRNLNIQQITWRTQDYLFAGKLKIDKLKIKYCSMLAARGAAQFPTLFHLQVKQRWELSSEPRAGNNILFLACLFLACFKENDRFGINSSSLTVRPTEFVSKERHITDMSCNRKKIIEPWQIVRKTCGSPTKIAMFACFCPSKKPLFSLFLQILPFPAKIQNKNTSIRLWSTNPIFCAQCLPNWRRKSTLRRALRTDKKKTTSFFARVMTSSNRMKSNFARLFPYVDDLFWLNDF